MAKPIAGEYLDDEISGLARLGLTGIVSLLEPHEADEVGLTQEGDLAVAHGLTFDAFPIRDRGLRDGISDFVARLTRRIQSGERLVVHCRAGIGRTGVIACAVLITAGYSPHDAIELVSEARGVRIPDTEAQRDWILGFSPNNL